MTDPPEMRANCRLLIAMPQIISCPLPAVQNGDPSSAAGAASPSVASTVQRLRRRRGKRRAERASTEFSQRLPANSTSSRVFRDANAPPPKNASGAAAAAPQHASRWHANRPHSTATASPNTVHGSRSHKVYNRGIHELEEDADVQ
jgi:hypothetical protein